MEARMRGVEDTRSRIVGAAMELHAEKGALATNWEDIAARAGVAPATVYRHFASLDQLIPACAQTVFDAIGMDVLNEQQIERIYAGARSPSERLERYIRGTCDCYARGDGWLHAARREADLIPAMNRAVEVQDKSNEVLVRAAFTGYEVDDESVAVLTALTDFPFWRSLTRGGISHPAAVRVICGLVQAELRKRHIRRRRHD
jgi:AcrR family transcriptional regulator